MTEKRPKSAWATPLLQLTPLEMATRHLHAVFAPEYETAHPDRYVWPAADWLFGLPAPPPLLDFPRVVNMIKR